MDGVVKILDRITGKVSTAVYAYSIKHRKKVYHVGEECSPISDEKFDKRYKILPDNFKP